MKMQVIIFFAVHRRFPFLSRRQRSFSDSGGEAMKILQGDCLDRLREMGEGSVNCCVTSPPYWGLRDYKTPPSVWGGDPAHDHAWNLKRVATEVGKGNWAQGTNGRGELQPGGVDAKREPIRGEVQVGFCECGAWLGNFGLEPTPELYVEHAVWIFREMRRVLRDDGTLFLNVGDSYYGAGYNNNKNTGVVALRHQRDFIGIELNPDYITMANNRILKELLS